MKDYKKFNRKKMLDELQINWMLAQTEREEELFASY